jgi:hypothetical protein
MKDGETQNIPSFTENNAELSEHSPFKSATGASPHCPCRTTPPSETHNSMRGPILSPTLQSPPHLAPNAPADHSEGRVREKCHSSENFGQVRGFMQKWYDFADWSLEPADNQRLNSDPRGVCYGI